MEDREERRIRKRVLALAGVLALTLAAFGLLLYDAQVANADYYREASRKRIANRETVEASRGIITDRAGRVLVGNKTTYQVTLDLSAMGDQASDTLLRLLEICREEEVEWTDELPVTQEEPWDFTRDQPFYIVDRNDETAQDTVIYTRLGKLIRALGENSRRWSLKDEQGMGQWFVEEFSSRSQRREAAAALMERLVEKYGLVAYTAEEQRLLAGVYYQQELLKQSILYDDVFAQDVDITFISRVKEEGLPGVNIETVSVRSYETDYAAHLLGVVGAIQAEDWESYKALGYQMDDTVGIDGAEAAFESWLRGTPGVRVVESNSEGRVVSERYETAPQPGSNVALTIDLGLQQAVEEALAERVPALDGARGAALVALDPRDGSILASASYPTYSLATYRADYGRLSTDPLTPLVNRAFNGTYAPGSTFKMVSAIAGLEEGVITTTEQIRDTGVYPYYDARPACWIYNSTGGNHGLETVSDAIRDSCNVFFYETMVRLDEERDGIYTLQEYERRFGLGEPTGVELPEETGVVAGPQFSEAVGQTWYKGNMLSAVIGQSDNKFTLLQMANYVATLVNGGNRYKVHLLRNVKSYDYSRVVLEYQPEVAEVVEMKQEHVDAVKLGMLQVTTEGTLARYFRDLDVQVGAKTGSAQVAGQENTNAMLVCFAPYDDPQIVLAIAVEAGGSGSELGGIAAEVLEYYFSASQSLETVEGENQLLR